MRRRVLTGAAQGPGVSLALPLRRLRRDVRDVQAAAQARGAERAQAWVPAQGRWPAGGVVLPRMRPQEAESARDERCSRDGGKPARTPAHHVARLLLDVRDRVQGLRRAGAPRCCHEAPTTPGSAVSVPVCAGTLLQVCTNLRVARRLVWLWADTCGLHVLWPCACRGVLRTVQAFHALAMVAHERARTPRCA